MRIEMRRLTILLVVSALAGCATWLQRREQPIAHVPVTKVSLPSTAKVGEVIPVSFTVLIPPGCDPNNVEVWAIRECLDDEIRADAILAKKLNADIYYAGDHFIAEKTITSTYVPSKIGRWMFVVQNDICLDSDVVPNGDVIGYGHYKDIDRVPKIATASISITE